MNLEISGIEARSQSDFRSCFAWVICAYQMHCVVAVVLIRVHLYGRSHVYYSIGAHKMLSKLQIFTLAQASLW